MELCEKCMWLVGLLLEGGADLIAVEMTERAVSINPQHACARGLQSSSCLSICLSICLSFCRSVC